MPLQSKPPGAPLLYADRLLPSGDPISVKDLADHLSIGRDTVYRAISSGELRAKRFPNNTAKRCVIHISRSSALVYIIKNHLIDPDQAYSELSSIIAKWPLYMKRNLITEIQNETL